MASSGPFVLLFVVALCASVARADIVTPPRPHAYDCALKVTALDFALNHVINGSSSHPDFHTWPQRIYDGLELADCGVPPPLATRLQQQPGSSALSAVFVAPDGSDTNGDGSQARPFATIRRALAAVQPNGSIALASGVYPQITGPATLVAGVHDGVTIEPASEGDRPVLTGAVQLSGLSWAPSPLVKGALMASLAPGTVDASQVRVGAGLTLTVDGIPYTLARWPNANPLYDRFPAGFSPEAEDQLPSTQPKPPSMHVQVQTPTDPESHFPTYSISVTDPDRWHQGQGKGGVVFSTSNFSARALQWADPTTAVYSHWDGELRSAKPTPGGPATYYDQWMNYFYKLNNVASGRVPCNNSQASARGDSASDELTLCFGRGGWQGYNSDTASQHRGGFVFNVREELDIPGEWFLEPDGSAIHVFPNATAGQPTLNASTVLALAQAETVLRVLGTTENPVKGVTVRGVTITGTRPTVLDMYERPGTNLAGWSVRRAGAVFVQGAEDLTIKDCTFRFTGGNAVVLSDHVLNAAITSSEFSFTGDSGIVSIGTLHGVDGTRKSFPDSTTVRGCLFHDLGWLGKQISGYTQFATARAQLVQNVMFNLPRSGWNLDDGFAGGTVIDTSLGFAAVRESADHGVINSWAREPLIYVNPSTGAVTIQPDLIKVTRSFFIASGGTLSNIDPDDGSFRQLHDHVVHAYAGRKNYLGREKVDQNGLYVFPDLGLMKSSCYFSDGDVVHAGWGEVYANNTCLLWHDRFATTQGGCTLNNLTHTVTAASNNRYFLNNSAAGLGGAAWCCGGECNSAGASAEALNLTQWQSHGQEEGSTVQYGLPQPADVVAMAKAVLGM